MLSVCWRCRSLRRWHASFVWRRWSCWRCAWRRSSQRPCTTTRGQRGQVNGAILGRVAAGHDLVAPTGPTLCSCWPTTKTSSLVSAFQLVTVLDHPLDPYVRPMAYICRKIKGVGVSQVKPSNCFRLLEKLVLPSVFWHKSFILHNVKLAELFNNSFEWMNVTFYGSKHTPTPPTYFQGVRTPTPWSTPCVQLTVYTEDCIWDQFKTYTVGDYMSNISLRSVTPCAESTFLTPHEFCQKYGAKVKVSLEQQFPLSLSALTQVLFRYTGTINWAL